MGNEKLYNRPQVKLSDRSIKKSNIWADDLFHRRECATMLNDLLTDGEDGLVVAINGSWGSGKTFFLRRWYEDLKHNEIMGGLAGFAVYYNAWEDDFFDDPLVPLLVNLRKPFEAANVGDKLWQSIMDSAKGVAYEASVALVNGLIKKITEIDVEALKKDCLLTASESALEVYEKATASRMAVRDGLVKLSRESFAKTGRYTVLIIDELDRCSPAFAVRLLERIKHLFSVPYLMVVLGIDKDQLSHTLHKFYGAIDVNNYLHRFIDMEFSLPAPDTTVFLSALWKRYAIESYFQTREERKLILTPLRRVRKILAYFARMHSLTLRETETVFKRFVLMFRTKTDHRRMHPEFVSGLIMLKFLDAKTYTRWISGRASVAKALDVLIPVPDVRNFPEAERIAAAFYAAHDGQAAHIAAPARTFLEHARKGQCRASEIRVAIPRFMGNYSANRLKQFAAQVDAAKRGVDGQKGCTTLEVSYIAKRLDFVAGDFGNHVGLPDGVAIA